MAVNYRIINDTKKTSYFSNYTRNITSQSGEDGILAELFQLIPITNSNKRYCVDIGAWDGKHLSNTYSLLHRIDQNNGNYIWNGLLIEANNNRLEECKKLYENNPNVNCLCSLVSFDGDNSLNNILDSYSIPIELDFLCIDIDGCDYHIWKYLTKYQPIVVCIEFNPTIPNDIVYIQTCDIRIHQGSSLLAITILGIELGYTLVVTTLFNAIFVSNKYLHYLLDFQLFTESISNFKFINNKVTDLVDNNKVINYINIFHSTSMITQLFQTYDGEIIYIGLKKLLWHKMIIPTNKFQLLNKTNRFYPFSPQQLDYSMILYNQFYKVYEVIQLYSNIAGNQKILNEIKKFFILCYSYINIQSYEYIVIDMLSQIVILISHTVISDSFLIVYSNHDIINFSDLVDNIFINNNIFDKARQIDFKNMIIYTVICLYYSFGNVNKSNNKIKFYYKLVNEVINYYMIINNIHEVKFISLDDHLYSQVELYHVNLSIANNIYLIRSHVIKYLSNYYNKYEHRLILSYNYLYSSPYNKSNDLKSVNKYTKRLVKILSKSELSNSSIDTTWISDKFIIFANNLNSNCYYNSSQVNNIKYYACIGVSLSIGILIGLSLNKIIDRNL